MTLAELKERAVLEALARHGGSKVKAAAELGVSLKTIYNVLDRLRSRRVEHEAAVPGASVSPETLAPKS